MLATAEEANEDEQFCGRVSPPVQKVFSTHAVHTPPLGPLYPGPHTHAVDSVLCAGEYELAGQSVRISPVQKVFSRHRVHVSRPYADGAEQNAKKQSDMINLELCIEARFRSVRDGTIMYVIFSVVLSLVHLL